MPSNRWEPGNSAYKDFLNTLTPEERKEHFAQREAKKNMKKAMQSVFEAKMEAWIAVLHNATVVMSEKALEGDVRAFEAMRDTLGCKPSNDIKVDEDSSAELIAAIKAMSKDLPD